MFKKGEYVIYGNAGVCQIIDISTLNMHGAPKDKLYYILEPVNGELVVRKYYKTKYGAYIRDYREEYHIKFQV